MAIANVAVAISKTTMWHGVAEEYSNVYYFDGPPVGGSNASLWEALIADIVAAERPLFGTNVTFKLGRVWSVGGSKVDNVTLALKDLTGPGTGGTVPLFKEAAILAEWECSRLNILGRKVYLRKYLRIGAMTGTVTGTVNTGETELPASERSKVETYCDKVQSLQTGASLETFKLCSPNGREPKEQNNGIANRYLISREFRRN